MIGPVIKYHRAMGSEAALALATRLVNYALDVVVVDSGRYHVSVFGAHVYSTTAMLSSLAQYAEVTGDQRTLDHLEAFVVDGITELAVETGWVMENFFQKNTWGEGNNTVDLIEIYLILGRLRNPAYYRRVERMLRAHLLPSQLVDTSFIKNKSDPDFGRSRIATQVLGAFGFPTPWGHEEQPGAIIAYNWDIVGGVVAGLAEVTRWILTHAKHASTIALHFDHEDALLHLDRTGGARRAQPPSRALGAAGAHSSRRMGECGCGLKRPSAT